MPDPSRSAYKCIWDDEEDRMLKNARRDWDRHPEIRAEHGGNFDRYIRSIKHNITTG